MNRRDFLTLAGSGVALSMAGCSYPSPRIDQLGIQLYTVRNLMELDLPGTLRSIADIGYRKVEFAGYYGLEYPAVKDLLAETGLSAPSTHATLAQLREDIDGWIGACTAVGHDYLVCSWMAPQERVSIGAWRGIVTDMALFGSKCRDAGITFAYHNHEFEFYEIEGVTPYDLILGETDPAAVKLELDWYWALFAGVDPAQLMFSHPDRFRLFHLKDISASKTMVDPGDGTAPFSELIDTALTVGGQHFYVERDNPVDALETAQKGYRYLSRL